MTYDAGPSEWAPSVLTIYQESYKVAGALFGCGETDYVTLLPGVAVQPCY